MFLHGGSDISDNTAGHGGEQLYSVCTADVTVEGASLGLASRPSQLYVASAANVTCANASFSCPGGARFVDVYNGALVLGRYAVGYAAFLVVGVTRCNQLPLLPLQSSALCVTQVTSNNTMFQNFRTVLFSDTLTFPMILC